MGAEDSGALFYAINNFSIIMIIVSLSLESGIIYFQSRQEIIEKELVSISLTWSLIAGGLSGLFIFLKPHVFSGPYNSPFYAFLFVSGSLLTIYFSGLFVSKRQFLYPHLIPAMINIIFLSVWGILFIKHKHLDAYSITNVYFISFFVTGIVMTAFYFLKYSLSFSFQVPEKKIFLSLLRYSGLAFLANVVSFLAYRVDYWILKSFSWMVSDLELGNYIQVNKFAQLFFFIPTVLASIVFPVTSSNSSLSIKHFSKMAIQIFLLNLLACGLLVLLGSWIFTWVFGESFSLMYSCFLYSIPAILSITLIRIIASYLAGINKIRYNIIGGTLALIFIIAFNYLLIPIMGINGAALADSIGYIVCLLILLWFFNKNYRNEKNIVAN